jgi:hypothetical protein
MGVLKFQIPQTASTCISIILLAVDDHSFSLSSFANTMPGTLLLLMPRYHLTMIPHPCDNWRIGSLLVITFEL